MRKKESQLDFDKALQSYDRKSTDAKAKRGKSSTAAKMIGFGAAAAGGLFASSQADADIIYSGNVGFTPVTLNGPGAGTVSSSIDLNGDLQNDFRFRWATDVTGRIWVSGVGNATVALGTFVAPAPLNTVARKFNSGDNISTRNGGAQGFVANWANGIGGAATPNTGNQWSWSPNGVTGFAGGAFETTGGAARFGWAEISIETDAMGKPLSITLERWAYEDSGAGITVGAIPEPGSAGVLALATLALGACGLRRSRRNKDEQA